MSHSTNSASAGKPAKPYEGFPLFPADNGQWAKKIRGKRHYFGSWREDPEGKAALEEFNRQWPYLSDGRTPPPISEDGCTLRELANAFLASKQAKLEAGRLSPRTFRDYFQTCEMLIERFGKDRRVDDLRPDDFRGYRAELAKRYGVVRLKGEINRVRILLKYALKSKLIKEPADYGEDFERPSALQMRRHRNQSGPKLFRRSEILKLIEAADVQLRAMILLGCNCGFGNTDVSQLPRSAVNLETGWVKFPRPKTEIPRRCPLWPETFSALQEALSQRPEPRNSEDERLCFLTHHGRPWVRMSAKKPVPDIEVPPDGKASGPKPQTPIDSVSLMFRRLLKALKINGRRGLGFYSFRHTFETIAGEAKDQVAVDSIMGHVDGSMAGNYRHAISDDRLRAVVAVVRDWLFVGDGEGGTP